MSTAVIDQPGLRIIFVGMALSLFLGLALKSQTSEQQIKMYLDKPISRLQKEFIIDYESAQIRLSNWGLPFPSLQINKLRLSPININCQGSQIYIDKLEIPVSLKSVLGLSQTVPKIRISEIELRLSEVGSCFLKGPKEVSNEQNTIKKIEDANSNTEDTSGIFSKKTKAELEEISIDKVKIISIANAEQPIIFKQMNINLNYKSSKLDEIKVNSKINALKDQRSDLFFLNAAFSTVIKARENQNIETVVHINGKLLDGDMQFFSHFSSDLKKMTYELNLNKASMRSLMPLVQKVDIQNFLGFEKIPLFISFSGYGEYQVADAPIFRSRVKSLVMNLDKGIIESKDIDINYFNNRYILKPFDVVFNQIDLNKFKSVDSIKNKTDSFENLGVVTGLLKYVSNDDMFMNGDIRNIQAIFSNRGRRDLQTIDEIKFSLGLKKDLVSFSTKKLKMNNSNVAGKIDYQYFLDTKVSKGALKLNAIKLNSAVWEQFTFVEQGPSLDISWDYQKNLNQEHIVRISMDELKFPNINLKDIKFELNHLLSFDGKSNRLSLSIKPKQFIASADFLNDENVKVFLSSKNGFTSNQGVISDRISLELMGQNWKNVDLNIESVLRPQLSRQIANLKLKGRIRSDKGLVADLLVQTKQNSQKFLLRAFSQDDVSIQEIQ